MTSNKRSLLDVVSVIRHGQRHKAHVTEPWQCFATPNHGLPNGRSATA